MTMVSGEKKLKGFATIKTCSVRDLEYDIVDSRNLYFGHADIIYPFVVEKGVSLPPEVNYSFKKMVKMTEFHMDPSPEENLWKGKDISKVLVEQ